MLSVSRWCRGARARIPLMGREKETEKEREKERSRMAEARPRAHAHPPLLRPVPHPAPPSSPASWLKPHPLLVQPSDGAAWSHRSYVVRQVSVVYCILYDRCTLCVAWPV